MNKRDFYKELMSEYMFDKDKICANAKKGKLAGRRPLPIYIGMTAAVAAAVVIVGTVVFTSFGKNGGVQIVDNTDLAALSATERLNRAIAEMKRNEGSEERIDVFITFRTQLSPKETQNLLLQFSDGSASVKMLRMSDGSTYMSISEIASVFRNNNGEVVAAVINCEGCKLAQINSNELVVLAEPVSENDNLANIAPVSQDLDTPDTSTSVPEPPKPEVPDNSNSSGNSSTHEPPDIDDQPGGNTDDPNSGSSSGNNSNSGSNSTSTSDPNNSGNTSDPSVNSDPNTSDIPPVDPEKPPVTPEKPAVTVPGIPEGVTLPYDVEKPSFITDDLGAQKAYFLSEDVFYVKSENAVSLYRWDGKRETLAATQAVADAKVAWVSENGLRMMISGVENGVRRKLFIVDAKNCTINDMQVGEMVGEGSIAEAAYNESLDMFALNVFDTDSRYIYTAKLSGYQPLNAEIAVYGSGNMSLLAAHNGAIYYSETVGNATVVYKCEKGEITEVKALDSLYVSALNSAFTHAIMIGSNNLSIFDPATESLIPINGGKASFGASRHSFSDGKTYYTISAGAIVPESGISDIAKIDFTRSFSTKWMTAISNGSVRIIPSVYSPRLKSEGITFAQPEEKASAEQRAVVNAAIGVINAIAGGTCKECGLGTSEKLTAAIDACFSVNEARYIKASCEISESDPLNYTGGSLAATNVSDTVLVMNSDLNGTLYVKAGTFDGTAGYRAVPITLTNENGRLLVDVII